MRIISKFRDYYDHVGEIYGKDPMIIYDRRPLSRSSHLMNDIISIEWDDESLKMPQIYIDKEHNSLSFKWIILAGKYYMIWNDSRESNSFKVYLKGESEYLDNFLKPKYYSRKRPEKIYTGFFHHSLVEISRLIKSPVFLIDSIQRNTARSDKVIIKINSRIPVLSDYGFSRIISPFDAFHDIEYFLSNVMQISPDAAPPVEIEDKYRIQQHGFDLKTSFRGK